jgi:hypothetical protein
MSQFPMMPSRDDVHPGCEDPFAGTVLQKARPARNRGPAHRPCQVPEQASCNPPVEHDRHRAGGQPYRLQPRNRPLARRAPHRFRPGKVGQVALLVPLIVPLLAIAGAGNHDGGHRDRRAMLDPAKPG